MTPSPTTPVAGSSRPTLDHLLLALKGFLRLPPAMRTTALGLLPLKGIPPVAKKAILVPGRLEGFRDALEAMSPEERRSGRIPVERLPAILRRAGVEVLDLEKIIEAVGTAAEGGTG